MRLAAGVIAVTLSCGPGNGPADYPPGPLKDLGVHRAPTYVARELLPARGIALALAHPRLGQPAIRRPGEAFDVSWIVPAVAGVPPVLAARITVDGAEVVAAGAACDGDGICAATAVAPPLALGLHGLCVEAGDARACSQAALAIVDGFAEPATVVHFSDTHIGDGASLAIFANVVDEINALDPPADLAIFTGDAADTGAADQRAEFLAQLARLRIPVYIVTGNHDYDRGGIDGHLLDVGPELDIEARYGALRLVGLSSGQDLDDGEHDTTFSESSGPDRSQLDWLSAVLAEGAPPTAVFFHHPIYNAFFATIGPDARDELKALVAREGVIAVLTGHLHLNQVYDAEGNSRGLSLDGEPDVPASRWPLHHGVARATEDRGGFALLHLGAGHVDYRWHGLP